MSQDEVLPTREQETTNIEQDADIVTIPVDQEWLEFLRLSFAVYTFEDLKLDMLKEILLSVGWTFAKVCKIRNSCFILTFEDPELIRAINWADLNMWVAAYSKSNWVDVITPRVAWLTVVGFPFIATSDAVLESLLRPVGSFVKKEVHLDLETSTPSINICVLTSQGEKIRFSRKVMIDNHLFYVSIEEKEKVREANYGFRPFDNKDKMSSWFESIDPSEAKTHYDMQTSLNDNDDQVIINEVTVSEENSDINPETKEMAARDDRTHHWQHIPQQIASI